MQNRTKELNEFEVTKPVYFRIVVEKRKDPEVSNLLLPSIKEAKGCVVDIWFLQEHSDEEYARAFSCARNFLKALVSSLPCPPWEGLRFRESGKEKKRWKELIG